MTTCSSNDELSTPLSNPESLFRKKRTPFVPNNRRKPRTVNPPFDNLSKVHPIVDLFLELPFPMADDRPMWATNRVVAPTPAAAIVPVNLGENFTIKGHHL